MATATGGDSDVGAAAGDGATGRPPNQSRLILCFGQHPSVRASALRVLTESLERWAQSFPRHHFARLPRVARSHGAQSRWRRVVLATAAHSPPSARTSTSLPPPQPPVLPLPLHQAIAAGHAHGCKAMVEALHPCVFTPAAAVLAPNLGPREIDGECQGFRASWTTTSPRGNKPPPSLHIFSYRTHSPWR
ncbi:hypothetical protein DAI22_08g110260 [Oryza sativa Japonica Group]|nr:hypothetical protein DAI22_08g110260 [Oryza sativa Japonica Group]